MAVLDARFDPSTIAIASVAAAARRGLEMDPYNHLAVTVDLLARGQDAVAFVHQAVERHEPNGG
jgi:hypothetical protein